MTQPPPSLPATTRHSDDARPVTAEWALLSKRPGDTKDYHIVAASGSLPPGDYEPLVRRWLPGTPSRDAGNHMRSDALPWVWFGPCGRVERLDLSAAVMTFGGPLRDAAGRRTDPTTCLMLPWEQVAAAQPSYRSLAEAVIDAAGEYAAADAQPSGSSPEGRRLLLPPADPADLVELIEGYGFEKVAGIAALLLESPVALVNASAVNSPDERLKVIDAITALLPYGCRADLGVGTWAPPQARLRLSFAERPRSEQVAVDWSSANVKAPRGEAADKYLRLLTELPQRHSLGQIVAYLSDQTDICQFSNASAAFDILRELDRPYDLWKRAADGGDVDAKDVRSLLDSQEQRQRLGAERVHDLAAFLTLQAQPDDLPRIRPHITRAERVYVFTAILQRLTHQEPGEFASELLTLAERPGELDQMLDDLVRIPDSIDDYRQELTSKIGDIRGRLDRLRESANLAALKDRALRLAATHLTALTPDRWPTLRNTLIAQPALAYELVEMQVAAGNDRDAEGTVRWLTGNGPTPDALTPLRELFVEDADPLTSADLDTVTQLDSARVLWFVETGLTCRRIDVALLWEWLPTAQMAGHSQAARWHRMLIALGNARTAAEDHVLLDQLGLILSGQPVVPLNQRLHGGVADAYLEAFPRSYHMLGDPARATVTDRLVEHVGGLSWTRPQDLAKNMLMLLHHLLDFSLPAAHANIVQLVENAVTNDEHLCDLPAYQQLWQHEFERSSSRPNDAPREEEHPQTGDELHALLDEFRRELRLRGVSQRSIQGAYSRLMCEIQAGGLEGSAANDFRRYVADNGVREVSWWVDRLLAAGMKPLQIVGEVGRAIAQNRRGGGSRQGSR